MIRSKFIRERKQFSDNNKYNIYATIFADCKSSSLGGSLYFGSSDSKAYIVSCSFTHCICNQSGGCVYTKRPTILQCCTFFRCETTQYASAFYSDKSIDASLIAICNCTSYRCAYRMTGDFSSINNINCSCQLAKYQVSCFTGRSNYHENKYATLINNTDVNGCPICLYGANNSLSFANIVNTKSIDNNNALFWFGEGSDAVISNCLILGSEYSKISSFSDPSKKGIVKFSNCWFDSESKTISDCTISNIVFNTKKDYIEFPDDISCKNIPFTQHACKKFQHESYIYFYVSMIFS